MPSTPEQAAEYERELAALRAEAGIDPPDPEANPGDLLGEVASFASLDACVRAHAVKDPLLGDAIDALGYDALVRDACRTLQALHDGDPKPCAPIAASALRKECAFAVAALLGKPAICPLGGTDAREEAREPLCLAWASRDARLCAAALGSERTACEALIAGDPRTCGPDTACARRVARYGALSGKAPKTTARPDAAAVGRVHVELHGAQGTPDPGVTSADFVDLAAAGVVVHKTDGGIRVSVGSKKSALWGNWDAPGATPHLSLEFTLPARDLHDASAIVGVEHASFDLLWPKVATFSNATAPSLKVEVVEIATEVGGPVKFQATALIGSAPRAYEAKFDVTSFVRDVVDRPR